MIILDQYFRQVRDIILNRQDCISGLLPASTAVTVHGNYTDAWVRDNVYSILAAWGLGLAYRKQPGGAERAYILEQSTVKLMRGLLGAMMRQAPKVERFKQTQHPLDALHAKYKTTTGDIVVGDHEWGHLQLDATSLFLLMLAQMTASGLRIVFTVDEVNFVQNLVHYISRSYRTPDYGIWERGNKMNHGIAEINASSLGMAKAALEAMAGCNLFGATGGQTGVIHVVHDDIARSRISLEALLPRESMSKEVDAALLSVTGFPAFAVDNLELRARTDLAVVDKLQGRYGCKRFLRDGHQTVLEDHGRLHYEPHELREFRDIESEWPLFFTYLLLNRLFAGQDVEAAEYRQRLDALRVERDGEWLLPELYFVPRESIEAERLNPGSQDRLPNENVPLVWAQSLYILGCLLQDGLVSLDDIDPLGRHRIVRGLPQPVQVAVLAEDETVQRELAALGIASQTTAEIAPVEVRDASELVAAYAQVGRNDRLGLTGRPLRMLRTLSTSRLYVLAGARLLFLPQFMSQRGFYITTDNRMLIERLRTELGYLSRHWDHDPPPMLVISVKQNMLQADHRAELLDFLAEMREGGNERVRVRFGRIGDFLDTVCREKINHLHDFSFPPLATTQAIRPFAQVLPDDGCPPESVPATWFSEWEGADDATVIGRLQQDGHLSTQYEWLALLDQRHGPDFDTGLRGSDGSVGTVGELLEEVYRRASDRHAWSIVRKCAGRMGKYDINLEQAVTEIVVRQHTLTVGKAYSNRATLKRPADSSEILQLIRDFNAEDSSQHIIVQELIVYLGLLVRRRPEWFADLHTVRVGHVLQLLIARQTRRSGAALDEAFNEVLALAPHRLMQLLEETLEHYGRTESHLGQVESLHYEGEHRALRSARFPATMNPDRGLAEDWQEWREREGSLSREGDSFFGAVWLLLQRSKGLMIGEKINSKRRLDSELIQAQMTPGEQTFRLHVLHVLNKIQAPVFRQLTVEALRALAVILRDNPELHIDDTVYTDILIGHAVRLTWLKTHPDYQDRYDDVVSLAWQSFFQLPPHEVANGILDALVHLLDH